MIVDQLLTWGFGVVSWVVSLLPTVAVDCSAMGGLSAWLTWVDGFIDMRAVVGTLSVLVGIEFAIWAFEAILFVLKKIPFLGIH